MLKKPSVCLSVYACCLCVHPCAHAQGPKEGVCQVSSTALYLFPRDRPLNEPRLTASSNNLAPPVHTVTSGFLYGR